MPDPQVTKLVAEPVFEINHEILMEGRHGTLLGEFMAKGGSLYYLIMNEEFQKNKASHYHDGELLVNVIRDYVRIAHPTLSDAQLHGALNEVRQNVQAPLRRLEDEAGAGNFPAAVEVRVTTDDDGVRVHYTVRDKDGKPLK